MKFIKLTSVANGAYFWFNAEKIIGIEARTDAVGVSVTHITAEGLDFALVVRETPEQILGKLPL